MARRRRRFGRRKSTNLWWIITQIILLIALLVAIVEVRDSIADGTSALVHSLTGEDVQVRDRDQLRESNFPGSRTDDDAERGPAVPIDDGSSPAH